MDRPALPLAVALLLLTAGCASTLADPPSRDDRAVALLEDAQAAIDDVETYRQAGSLRVVATSDGDTRRVEFEIDGAVNVTAQRARNTAIADDQQRSAFVIEDRIYQECSAMRGTWGVENHSAGGAWVETTPAARQLSLLESGALRIEGAGTVDGQQATVLEGRPSGDALERYGDRGSQPIIGGSRIQNPTVRVWVANETALPLKVSLDFAVSGGGGSADASMTMRYSDYGEPVSIELPDEARGDVWETGCPGG